jgi:hypothetical protein
MRCYFRLLLPLTMCQQDSKRGMQKGMQHTPL